MGIGSTIQPKIWNQKSVALCRPQKTKMHGPGVNYTSLADDTGVEPQSNILILHCSEITAGWIYSYLDLDTGLVQVVFGSSHNDRAYCFV